MGQPHPVTEFERPGGREIERDFRGVAHGVSARVDRLKSLGNSIVPQIAFEIFKAIEQTESAQIKGLVVKR
jgi:DNA (cytosine-5)-methyltransferase 1